MAVAHVGGKRLVILGGGLSGLSYLHYLRNFAAFYNKDNLISKVTLLEANNYMGGSVKSNTFEDGAIHELGPRSVRVSGVRAQNTIILLEQLGLEDKVMLVRDTSSAATNRYIYNDDQLFRLPMSIGKVFHKLPASKTTLGGAILTEMFKKTRMNLDEVPHRDPSIYDFFSYRFGPDVGEKILDPLMRGITAGDARKLSTRALFGDLLEKEQAYGGILRGMGKPPLSKIPHDELFPNDVLESKLLNKFQREKVISYNLSSGLQTLPEHLSNSLLNTNNDGLISIYNQTKILSIKFQTHDPDEAPCSVTVQTVDGDHVEIQADHVVSAIPSKDLAAVLPESTPVEYRKALDNVIKIPHSPVGCVCVEYRNMKDKLPDVINSFGFLTHSKSGSRVLGISFDSTMFPEIDSPLDSTRMTCMIGGSWFKEVLGTDDVNKVTDAQLEQIALEEIRKILKIKEEPHRISTLLWKTGIAQYEPGHKERLTETRQSLKDLAVPLTLLGQSYDGVAVNDVIFASRMAASDFVKSLL